MKKDLEGGAKVPVDLPEMWHTILLILSVFILLFLFQRFSKKILERDQYYFLKDIGFVAAWLLCGVWAPTASIRSVIAISALAAVVGVAQRVTGRKAWSYAFFGAGSLMALSGLHIDFIGLPGGDYVFLGSVTSILITGLWVGLFPLLIQELDRIPGMAGFLLAITWAVMLFVTGLSRQHLGAAFFMSFAGFMILSVFWSRHGHPLRKLGEPLAGMWGVLLAGTSILGVSKGVAFSTLMILPLGLFAIPMVEASAHFVSTAFASRSLRDTSSIYNRMMRRGLDHRQSIHAVGSLCAFVGSAVAAWQLRNDAPAFWVGMVSAALFAGYFSFILLGRGVSHYERRPLLWGIPVDNVAVDYALGKIRSWIRQGAGNYSIITLDALGALRAREDNRFADVIRRADLVLPDGKGLTSAMRLLGAPIRQRIAGVDFAEKMCRLASTEGLPVFFLGGREGIADRAAANLKKRYPGLKVAGIRNGYFDYEQESDVLRDIAASGAKFLFVGLGVPRQEFWMDSLAERLNGVVSIGVGGSFDVISGELRRAPVLWQRTCLEWLYRLIQEPWRWKRVIKLPMFVFYVLIARTGITGSKGDHIQ